jgi:hypothetical protein
MVAQDSRALKLREVGTVDYETGKIQLVNLSVQRLINNRIELYARTTERDITSQRKTILSIRDEDINVKVEQVRI